MSEFKSFISILEVPVEELNIRELELIAFIAHLNAERKCTQLIDLQKLLKEKFIESSLAVNIQGVATVPRPESPVIGRGGSHIWITRKQWLDDANKKGQMCDRTMMIVQEEGYTP